MRIEVAYAPSSKVQTIVELDLPEGSTLGDALAASGLLDRYPEIDLESHGVGIFGKVYPAERKLWPGDRVEIYRPLINDPREARRERARNQRR